MIKSDHVSYNGFALEPGTTLSIHGEKGLFRFCYATVSEGGDVSLTFIGGPSGHEKIRSFRPERLKAVQQGRRK